MAGQGHADLTEADDHHVIAQGLGLGVQVGQRRHRRPPGPVQEAPGQARGDRGHGHGHRDRDRQDLDRRLGDQAGRGRETEQDEGELAALGQNGAELGGQAGGEAEPSSQRGEQHALEQDEPERDQHDLPRCWTATRDPRPCRRS